MKKGGHSHYDYKLYSKVDCDFGLVQAIETTPASVHDSRVDLSLHGEVVYRDRGYAGAPARGHDATMRKGAHYCTVTVRNHLRNARISRKRTPVERHCRHQDALRLATCVSRSLRERA